jgi:hypothetical protein
MQNSTHSSGLLPMTTGEGKQRCRFDLFVQLNDGVPSKFNRGVRSWCFRGDTFTQNEDKMLINLLNLMKRYHAQYKLMHLWDNNYSKNDPDRTIFQYFNGVIEKNILWVKYSEVIAGCVWPSWIKDPVNPATE